MKKRKILTHPTVVSSMQFDDFDFDSTQVRLERLRAKALRKMRHQFE